MIGAARYWAVDMWAPRYWVKAGVGASTIPAVLEDLTTLWCQDYQPALHLAKAVGAVRDDTTLVAADEATLLGYDGEQDKNTAAAKYIETEF